MLRTDALKGLIVERGMSQMKVATALGITPKTFYEKMTKGVFCTDEDEARIALLEIEQKPSGFMQGLAMLTLRDAAFFSLKLMASSGIPLFSGNKKTRCGKDYLLHRVYGF